MLSLLAAASLVAFAVVDSLPHDEAHFTQGLSFAGGTLLETTGRYGESGLYIYDAGFKARDSLRLEERYFGEGSVALGNDAFWLTWKAKKVFKIDLRTMQLRATYKIPTEGWGLTFCAGTLLLSDGTDEIFKVQPEDFRFIGSFKVRDGPHEIRNLNELECVDGLLYANLWQSDSIAVIIPQTGRVKGYLDFSEKARSVRAGHRKSEVLNGIAYDGEFLWLTGKYWPWLYKVRLIPK